MKILVDHTRLVDSPYDGESEHVFEFSSVDTEDLTQDILLGPPTTYLISGYRGAGKSSFIKKLEKGIKQRSTKAAFIHLNFAKYEDHSILLRKLIRSFYHSIKENRQIMDVINNPEEQLKHSFSRLEDLYDRTFYEVSKNSNEKRTETNTAVFGYNVNLKDILLTCFSVISALGFAVGLDFTKSWHYVPLGASIIWSVAQFISIEQKKVKEHSQTEEISKNSFYDDEIAEHYLFEILKSFQDHVQPIFVLDELDKIKNDELVESLINELKPIMLSGLASFIVVAGQNLYYNYYSSQSKDDGILSSLFSKVHHIPLFSTPELRVLFSKLVTFDENDPEYDDALLNAYVDFLIFESKKIPRRFVGLIRQNLSWEGEKAFIEIETPIDDLQIYSRILDSIENIEDSVIAVEVSQAPLRDYFSMQLMIKAQHILRNGTITFTESEILNYNGE